MNCFTCSGLFKSASRLMRFSAFLTNFIVTSALPLFFIFMSTFKTAWVAVERAGVAGRNPPSV